MILVTGATGHVGSEVVKALAAQGTPVRGLVRSPEKAAALAGPLVEIVAGDMTDPASLDAALVGVDHVFLLSPTAPNQVLMEGNVIEAAQRAGVEHVVKLSARGESLDSPVELLRNHATNAAKLQASGLGWTILVANEFMQNLLGQAGSIKSADALYLPMGEGQVSLIDTRDVARAAAVLLTEPGHQGKKPLITGQSLSMRAVAATLSEELGREVSYGDVPPAAAREAMLGMGMPEWLVGQFLGLMAGWATGNCASVTSDFREITGQEPRRLADFVRDYAGAFSGVDRSEGKGGTQHGPV